MEIKNRVNHEFTYDGVIEYILRSRGIAREDIKKFLFPDSSLKPDYRKLDNIEAAVQKLKEHIDKGTHIRVPVDFDADGFTSAAIIYQFIKDDLGHSNISKFIPNGKVHGINLEDTLESGADLLFVTDAGSSDFEEHMALQENGCEVVIVDHHLVEGNRYSDNAIVVNNQLSGAFPWKALTGAPMTLLFCEAYRDKYNLDIDLEEYQDLAAIGLISDRADLRDTGAFYMAQKGLSKINNPLIKHILENDKNVENSKSITPKVVEWTIAPAINAMTRVSNADNVKLVVDAISGDDYMVYNSRLKDEFPLVEESARKMRSTRSNQSTKVKKALESLEERIVELGTAEHKVLLANVTGITDNTGLNGLIAIKLASEYKRPTLVLSYNEKNGLMTGSGRNFSDSPLESFKDTLEETGLFEYVAGHDNAFGVGLTVENAMNITEVLNEKLFNVQYDSLTHYVDISYARKPDAHDIMDIANHEWLWANGIDRPLIHVHSIEVKKKDIKFIGKAGNTWKLTAGVVDCVMFNLTEEQKLSLTNNHADSLVINVVGEAGINTFMGQKKPQLILKDFEVKEGGESADPWNHFDVTALPF